MENYLQVLVIGTLIAAVILILWKVGSWAVDDANLRGKPPALVFIAVIFFFPWGLIAWLVFRPDPPSPRFDLRRFRRQ